MSEVSMRTGDAWVVLDYYIDYSGAKRAYGPFLSLAEAESAKEILARSRVIEGIAKVCQLSISGVVE